MMKFDHINIKAFDKTKLDFNLRKKNKFFQIFHPECKMHSNEENMMLPFLKTFTLFVRKNECYFFKK